MSKRRKVTVVGAGNVGATCAQVLALRDYADVILVDIKEGLPQGKALDINQMGAALGYEPNVVGTNGYEESAGSSVVVITAGVPRGPGMSRDDLVSTNEKIVKAVTEQVVAETTDTIWSPWPPSTTALTSLTEAPVSHAMKVAKRDVSSTPAIPTTRSRGQPETFFATWHIASSGFETTIRIASGDCATTFDVTSPTIFSFVETRSSRDIPGERGRPAVITTTSEPAVSS